MVVVRIRLHEVNDIESVYLVFASVLDSKKVPLSEAIGTIVVF